MSRQLEDQASALIIQRRQTDEAQGCLSEVRLTLDEVAGRQQEMQGDLDALCAWAEEAITDCVTISDEMFMGLEVSEVDVSHLSIAPLDYIDVDAGDNWGGYFVKLQAYATRNDLSLSEDPFASLLSPTQKIILEKRIREEFSLKNANCDKFDYIIAGTCGFIGGLVDVLFVGLPGEGPLTKIADDVTASCVQKFAGFLGWPGPANGSDPTRSAIGFLEFNKNKTGEFKGFGVNYDQRHSGDVDKLFDMRAGNHHLKSIGHWPDLIGLVFSILDQFNSTSHFVDGGRIISINTETFTLSGSTFVSKVFSGFVNWFGHLMSDIAGSSGSAAKGNRGSGIPIPFFGLLQFLNIGKFGQDRQTFAKIAVQVFEQGYDFRHGMALAVPVLLTELLVRVMWTFKRRFHHDLPWGDCLPSANNPELRRMLLVGHGTLCIVDGADAALRSGGNMIQFMLRANVIGWARFGTLALKELRVWCQAGGLDAEAVDIYLDAECERLFDRV